jgi:hypothetical protein
MSKHHVTKVHMYMWVLGKFNTFTNLALRALNGEGISCSLKLNLPQRNTLD